MMLDILDGEVGLFVEGAWIPLGNIEMTKLAPKRPGEIRMEMSVRNRYATPAAMRDSMSDHIFKRLARGISGRGMP